MPQNVGKAGPYWPPATRRPVVPRTWEPHSSRGVRAWSFGPPRQRSLSLAHGRGGKSLADQGSAAPWVALVFGSACDDSPCIAPRKGLVTGPTGAMCTPTLGSSEGRNRPRTCERERATCPATTVSRDQVRGRHVDSSLSPDHAADPQQVSLTICAADPSVHVVMRSPPPKPPLVTSLVTRDPAVSRLPVGRCRLWPPPWSRVSAAIHR